jgi:hypothetical protein
MVEAIVVHVGLICFVGLRSLRSRALVLGKEDLPDGIEYYGAAHGRYRARSA